MQAHLQDSVLVPQVLGLAALTSLCYGHDAAMFRATEGGALRAAVAAMRAHPQDEGLQLMGAQALIHLGKGEANKHRVTEAGGRVVVSAAMEAFPKMKGLGKHLLGVLPLGLPTRRERGQNIGRV